MTDKGSSNRLRKAADGKLERLRARLLGLLASEQGADLIEYAMIGTFMILVGAALLNGVTAMLGNAFVRVGNTLTGSL